mgnify:CR=1 FL=1
MTVRLFDIQNDVVIPTEHVYTLKFLKDITEKYPDKGAKVLAYLFYMTCPNPDMNPFFHMLEEDKETLILEQIDGDFSPEDDLIITALEMCGKMYETPTLRAYNGIKSMLDKLARFMEDTDITTGRDGNGTFILAAAKNFQDVRESFKGAYKDLAEEQKSNVRGGANIAYDQR